MLLKVIRLKNEANRQLTLADHAWTGCWLGICRSSRVRRVEKSTYHYCLRRPEQAQLKQRIREIADPRGRHAYQRIHVLLCCDGCKVNPKRVYRPFQKASPRLKNKAPKRRVKPLEHIAQRDHPLRGTKKDRIHDRTAVRSRVPAGLCPKGHGNPLPVL